MKKILLIAMACVLSLGLVGGAFAAFSDTETSTGNTFTAGTLDLKMGAPSPYYNDPVGLFVFSDIAPGDTNDIEIGFKNVGTITGQITFNLSLADYDGAGTGEFGPGDVGPNNFAKCLIVTAAEYDRNQNGTYDGGTENVLADYVAWGDTIYGNNDGYLSIYEMAQVSWVMGETLAGGAATKVKVSVQFDDSFYGGDVNDLQAEGVEVTITATLDQA